MFSDGFLAGAGLRLRAVGGRAGISAGKREGDEATPAGLLPLRQIMYRADRVAPPRCAVPVSPISPADGWCDDVHNAAYNRAVRLPFAGRHESLWRDDGIYDVIGVLGWNSSPIVAGRGSAIFLHVAQANYAPTEGCIALALPDLFSCLAAGLSAIFVAA